MMLVLVNRANPSPDNNIHSQVGRSSWLALDTISAVRTNCYPLPASLDDLMLSRESGLGRG